MTIIVQHNQSLLDIAMQETGSVETVTEIADANNLAITQLLVVGQEIIIPEGLVGNSDILNYYNKNNIRPATGQTPIDGSLFEVGLFEPGLFE